MQLFHDLCVNDKPVCHHCQFPDLVRRWAPAATQGAEIDVHHNRYRCAPCVNSKALTPSDKCCNVET